MADDLAALSIVNAAVGAAFVVAFIVYASALAWYQRAAAAWTEVALPELESSPAGQIRESRATFRTMSQPAADPTIELLRVRAHRRWTMLVFLVPTIIVDPLLAGIFAVGLLRATQVGVIATVAAVIETVLISMTIVRLGRMLIAFGNGADVTVRQLASLAAQVGVIALVMSVQIVVLSR